MKTLLTNKQILFFKENGYLILEDFIDTEITKKWKEDFTNYFEVDITKHTAYPLKEKGNGKSINALTFSDKATSVNELPQTKAILKQLGGNSFRGGKEQFIIHAPITEKKVWKKPNLAHIDLTPKHFNWRFMLGYTAYGSEVKKDGGCFIFWPKSHLKIWEFIQKNPDFYFDDYEHSADILQKKYQDIIHGEPVQFIAKPGTLMIWHSFLLHNGSMNVTDAPRIGIFGRWGQQVAEHEKREKFNDIWENWNI